MNRSLPRRPRASAAERPRDSARELHARALRLLARREYSRVELARRLAPHTESTDALERLLDELVGRKQLSDERYAEARARQLARKYGTAHILHSLRAKGVGEDLTERAAAEMGADELERAHNILRRKYRAAAATREQRAARARFLLGRGFSAEVVRRALALSSDEKD